jgi:hypothetical protein
MAAYDHAHNIEIAQADEAQVPNVCIAEWMYSTVNIYSGVLPVNRI